MAVRIKVCPKCNEHNPGNAQQCSCGCSLSDVNPQREDIVLKNEEAKRKELEEQKAKEAEEAAEAEKAKAEAETVAAIKKYRICPDCNHHNPCSKNLCEECTAILAGVPITTEVEGEVQADVIDKMTSLDGDCVIELQVGETLIGAGNVGAEYLESKMYVTGSRPHCKVTREADGKIYIEDMGSTNGTFVDGKKIPCGQKVLINQENEIGLGGSDKSKTHSAFFRLG